MPASRSDTFVRSCDTDASCSGWPYGSGRTTTSFTMVKIAAAAPMPIESVSSTVAVNAGARRGSWLHAQHELDAAREPLPPALLGGKLAPASGGERVITRAAVVL